MTMAPTVAVLGATGVYGRHLLPRLVAAGYRVRALVRTPAAVPAVPGIEVRAADIFDAASLHAGLGECEIAINLATALPSPAKSGGDYELTNRIRRQGVPIFLSACEANGVRRVLQQSIAMIHGGGGDILADEETYFPLPEDTTAGRALAAVRVMEHLVTATSLDWLILRGGLFYGPGTGFDDDWFARARAGKLKLPEAGDDYITLVHIADMADATVAALAHWPSRRALIIADDEPPRWRDLFSTVAAFAGAPPPVADGPVRFPSVRASNRRAREILNWRPHYPNHRIGLVR